MKNLLLTTLILLGIAVWLIEGCLKAAGGAPFVLFAGLAVFVVGFSLVGCLDFGPVRSNQIGWLMSLALALLILIAGLHDPRSGFAIVLGLFLAAFSGWMFFREKGEHGHEHEHSGGHS